MDSSGLRKRAVLGQFLQPTGKYAWFNSAGKQVSRAFFPREAVPAPVEPEVAPVEVKVEPVDDEFAEVEFPPLSPVYQMGEGVEDPFAELAAEILDGMSAPLPQPSQEFVPEIPVDAVPVKEEPVDPQARFLWISPYSSDSEEEEMEPDDFEYEVPSDDDDPDFSDDGSDFSDDDSGDDWEAPRDRAGPHAYRWVRVGNSEVDKLIKDTIEKNARSVQDHTRAKWGGIW
jgi:hypothetical protein